MSLSSKRKPSPPASPPSSPHSTSEGPVPVLIVNRGVSQSWAPPKEEDREKWKRDHQSPDFHVVPLTPQQLLQAQRSRFPFGRRGKRKRAQDKEEETLHSNSNITVYHSSLPSPQAKKHSPDNVFKRHTNLSIENPPSESIEVMDPEDELFSGLEECASNTLLALQSCLQRFPVQEGFLPVVLRSHVYSVIHDRSEADRELSEMHRKNLIRLFKLFGAKDEFAIVMTTDFTQYVMRMIEAHVEKQLLSQKKANSTNVPSSDLPKPSKEQIKASKDFQLIEHFVSHVLPARCDVTITKEKLLSFYEPRITEQDVSFLVNFGLLTLHESNSFWLSIPQGGLFFKSCLSGRKEVLSWLQRTKLNEILLSDLEKRTMKHSKLSVSFHIKDLLGLELVQSIPLQNGTLIRLASKKP